MERKLLIIIVLIVTNVLTLGTIIYQYYDDQHEPKTLMNNGETDYIFVYITGEVLAPNVYRIPNGTRLFELIELAGGKTEVANLSTHNLSLVLKDEMRINIPALLNGDPSDPSVPFPDEQTGLVNINTASLTMLMSLKGIGEVKAQNILDFRNNIGPFYFIEDIMFVSGIGEKTFEDIKDAICV